MPHPTTASRGPTPAGQWAGPRCGRGPRPAQLARIALLAACVPLLMAGAHPWPRAGVVGAVQTLESRFVPPPGFVRGAQAQGSYAAWLRALPLLPGRPAVLLHDGRRKGNQRAHAAVIDIDVGRRDLQQCADAAIRLRAEYLWAAGRRAEICFRAAAGYAFPWSRYSRGVRPPRRRGEGWSDTGTPGRGYRTFRHYLDRVFGVANTASLMRQTSAIPWAQVRAGDVVLQAATGARYGHAVTVLDVVTNAAGQRRLLLAQSYMPAQQLHVLRRPGPAGEEAGDLAWYAPPAAGQPFATPEWTFPPASLRRFVGRGCP